MPVLSAIRGDSRQIDACFSALADYIPGIFQSDRKRQLARKNIYGPKRQDSQARAFKTLGGITDSVENFVYRAIPPSGDNDFETFADCLSREATRISGRRGQFQRIFFANGIQVTPEALGFFASGTGIENDARAHARIVRG